MKYFAIGRAEEQLPNGAQMRGIVSFEVIADSDATAMEAAQAMFPDALGLSITHCDNQPPGRPLQLREILSGFERDIVRQFTDAADGGKIDVGSGG